MAWRRSGDKPVSEPMMAKFIDPSMRHAASVFDELNNRINLNCLMQISINLFAFKWHNRFSWTNHSIWALFQYPIKRLMVRSRKALKPRDLYLKLSDRSEIWHAPRQQCCRRACKIPKRCEFFKPQSCAFETARSHDKTSYRILKRGPGLSARYIMNSSTLDMHSLITVQLYAKLITCYRWLMFTQVVKPCIMDVAGRH